MAPTDPSLDVLKMAAELRLPERIGRDGAVPFAVVQALIAAEQLQGVLDAGGNSYGDVRITVRGRERLGQLTGTRRRRQDRGHKMLVLGILIAMGTVLAVSTLFYLYTGHF